MRSPRRISSFVPSSLLALLMSFAFAASAEDAPMASGQNVKEMHFVNFPVMPTCATGAVVNGDPGKGPSIILAKTAQGCTFPWHWHTPGEHIMMVSGSAKLEMKDGKPVTLTAGGFAMMPSKHIHQFHCLKTCELFVYSDATFDMHYVDASGNEISVENALGKVHEVPPKGTQ